MLKDTMSYNSKQENISGIITVGYGVSGSASYGKSKVNADYASVNEQSGIFAGDDGYQINIKNHTDLKGGFITSTAKAEKDGKNSFATGTLKFEDLANKSEYKGEAIGLGVSGSVKGENPNQNSRIYTVDKSGMSNSMGYGKESDSQHSTTHTGINTNNIVIRDNEKQKQITGKSAEETKQAVKSDLTVENYAQNAGYLANNFDKEKVQNEIDLQVKVTQEFGNNLKQLDRLQNERLDKLKAQKDAGEIDEQEYNRQAETIQNQKLIAKMVGAGLLSPADNVLGVVTSAVSPAISYEIGQYFKAHNAENTPAHIATHAILGAIVSGANGGNALSGAISAGGAEAIAPIVAKVLYGKDNSQNLTADEKETVVSVTTAISTIAGGAIGDTSANAYIGNTVATNAVENNSLHIAKNGVVAQNIDDGDMNIYQYDFECKTQEECRNANLKLYQDSKKEVGQVMWQDSFTSPDTGLAGGKVYLGESIEDYIYTLNYKAWANDSAYSYAKKSKPGGEYDLKSNYPGHADKSFHGFLFQGKYISLRDAGNILAGMNAAVLDIPFKDFQKTSGGLHRAGMFGAGVSYLTGIPFGSSPTYGELPYQYHKSEYGYRLGRQRVNEKSVKIPKNVPSMGEIFYDIPRY